MSDPDADSAPSFDGSDAAPTGAATAADSTAAARSLDTGGGQEQGDQSSKKRIDGLMSLAQKRTAERDAALQEVEGLRQQLEAQTLAEQQALATSQVEAMFPERFAQPEPEPDAADGDDGDETEPYVRVDPNMAPRSRSLSRSVAPAPASTPAARYAQEQAEIAAMKARLNVMGQQWYDGAKEQGLLD